MDTVKCYTGIPDRSDNAFWHEFWANKLAAMGRQVQVFSRPLRYRNQTIELPDGTQHTMLVGEEKGIDVR
ncbi:MAG: NYN domain-containing protein, partial [Fidelibacterota bacterium]